MNSDIEKLRTELRDVLAKLSEAVDVEEKEDIRGALVTDFVVVVARRYWDDKGRSFSQVRLVPASMEQPSYVTLGLLDSGSELLDDIYMEDEGDDDGQTE